MTTVVNHHLPSWSAVIVVSIVAAVSLAPVSLCSVQQSSSGNGLWDDLVGKCDGPRNTMDCVRSRLYNYVDHTFESDFNITDGLIFTKNSNDYESMCPGNNETTTTSYREARAPEMVISIYIQIVRVSAFSRPSTTTTIRVRRRGFFIRRLLLRCMFYLIGWLSIRSRLDR